MCKGKQIDLCPSAISAGKTIKQNTSETDLRCLKDRVFASVSTAEVLQYTRLDSCTKSKQLLKSVTICVFPLHNKAFVKKKTDAILWIPRFTHTAA